MTITATQIANTTTESFDVSYQYFSGVDYVDVTFSDFTSGSVPVGWSVSGNTITPDDGFVDVTDRVIMNGSFMHERKNSSIIWSVNLEGVQYDSDYFSVGKAIVSMVKYTRPGYNSGWILNWIGRVDDGTHRDTFRHNGRWSRTIKSGESALTKTDAPRIFVGQTDIARNASVSVSSTLAVPAVEARNNEFFGSTANVDGSNIVDGTDYTVWISENVPTPIGANGQIAGPGRMYIDEVFFLPVTGYNQTKTWWIEFYKAGSPNAELCANDWSLLVYNTDGDASVFSFKYPGGTRFNEVDFGQYQMDQGDRIIVCANRDRFEAYTGGTNDARYVVDVSPFGGVEYNDAGDGWAYNLDVKLPFNLDPENGYVVILEGDTPRDVVKWGTVSLPIPNVIGHWPDETGLAEGDGVDISGIINGQSLLRSSPTDTDKADDWALYDYPRPGQNYWTPDDREWVKIEIEAHGSIITENVSASAETIYLNNTNAWPPAGDGVVEGDEFSYGEKTSTSLTSVTNLSSPHSFGAEIHPYDDDIAQTGYRANRLLIRRLAGLSNIKTMSVYLGAESDLRTPDDDGWESDYYGAPFQYSTKSETGKSDIVFDLSNRADKWVRTILIIIEEMFSGDRAKINTVSLFPDYSEIDNSGLNDVGATFGELVYYLINNGYFSPFTVSDFYDWTTDTVTSPPDNSSTGTYGKMSGASLALHSIVSVIDDLARNTGCIIEYSLDGSIVVNKDPWFPTGVISIDDLSHTFSQDDIRGEPSWSDFTPNFTGVALSSTTPNGNALPRIVYPIGVTGSNIKEFTGYTVQDTNQNWLLAQSLWFKEFSTETIQFDVKGIGEWCSPLQVVEVTYDIDNDGEENPVGRYIIENIARNWKFSSSGKSFKATINARRYLI